MVKILHIFLNLYWIPIFKDKIKCIFKSSGMKCISILKLCEVLKLNESSLITWVAVPDSGQIYSRFIP